MTSPVVVGIDDLADITDRADRADNATLAESTGLAGSTGFAGSTDFADSTDAGIAAGARTVAAAAREAAVRRAPLWLGHAYPWLPPAVAGVGPGGDTAEGAVRDAAIELLAQVVTRVHAEHPELEIHTYAMSGQPGPCLADLAKDAALLVVGGRGRGGFTGMLLGSVALSTVGHARCPVLVVHGEDDAVPPAEGGRVLVGVDLNAPITGAEVLEFAFAEAALHRYDVRVVHAWQDPGRLYPAALRGYPRARLDELDVERHRALDSLVAPWREKHPGVKVETRVLTGPPSKVLVDGSRRADLVVLGGRRRPDEGGTRLGGLAHVVLQYARCPVLIVPEF